MTCRLAFARSWQPETPCRAPEECNADSLGMLLVNNRPLSIACACKSSYYALTSRCVAATCHCDVRTGLYDPYVQNGPGLALCLCPFEPKQTRVAAD